MTWEFHQLDPETWTHTNRVMELTEREVMNERYRKFIS